LVILSIQDNDITDNVALLCPPNSYKTNVFNPDKGTIILLKKDDLYEPVYLYGSTKTNKSNNYNPVVKIFDKQHQFENLNRVFDVIRRSIKNNCRPVSIKSRVYEYEENLPAAEIATASNSKRSYNIKSQVMNYRGKVIALMVTDRMEDSNALYVPTYPSAVIQDAPIIYIDDVKWLSYAETYLRLNELNRNTNRKIRCKPIKRIIEDEMIVGLLTETNQFIPIDPPEQNTIPDDLAEPEYQIHVTGYKNNGYYESDTKLTTSKTKDSVRVETIQNISLETHFYISFRNKIRMLLNEYYNKEVRTKIVEIIKDERYLYQVKIAKLEILLKYLLRNSVSFDNFNNDALASLRQLSTLVTDYDTKRLCLVKSNKICLPKENLVSGIDNEALYFSRMADELLRYKRIRLFMLEPKRFLNITKTDFKINENEVLLLQSLLYGNYFDDLIPFDMNEYIKNITYEMANPMSGSQHYSNFVSLDDQVLEH